MEQPLSISQQVKDLGRKARERLQEERAKRREIVRLEDGPATEEPPTTRPQSMATKLLGTAPKKNTGKRKRVALPSKVLQTREDPNVDCWYPDVTDFETYEGEDRSSLVRLHGLPRHCKPEDIRRFFSSLDPERVIVLPSMSTQIAMWDTDMDDTATTIPRHPSTFRAHVKFPSSPLAVLAVDRTGEILYSGQGDEKVGVKIAVTLVSKEMAKYILKHMAIDAVYGTEIAETLDHVESNLHKSISSLLWKTILQKLRMTHKIDKSYPWHIDSSKLNPSGSFHDYQLMTKLCNQHIDEYDKLLDAESILRMIEFDPTWKTTILSLTHAAAWILSTEVHALQERLCRARFERQNQKVEEDDDDDDDDFLE